MRIEKVVRRGKEVAILPMDGLKRLMEVAEMLADVKAYDAAKGRLERGEDELIPLEIVECRLAGESAVKVWREHRGMTQEKLAKAAGVSRPMIAGIEAGNKRGGIATLKKLAEALRIDLDHLACFPASRFRDLPNGLIVLGSSRPERAARKGLAITMAIVRYKRKPGDPLTRRQKENLKGVAQIKSAVVTLNLCP